MKSFPLIWLVFFVVIIAHDESVFCDEVLTGVIVDAVSGQKLVGVDVNLYQLLQSGEEASHRDSKKTDGGGVYRFELKDTIRPMRLSCLKFAATGSQHLYGPVNIEPLNGGEGVVNIALTSSDGESLQSAQARLRNLNDLLKNQKRQKVSMEIVPAAKLENYLSGVIASFKVEHDFPFGNELASIVEAIRNDNSEEIPSAVGFAKGMVWQVKAGSGTNGKLTTWELPTDLTNPVTVAGIGKRITWPFFKDQAGNSQPVKYNLTASNDSLCMLATNSFAGNEKTWAAAVSIDSLNVHVADKQQWFWGDVTSTAGQPSQPFTARGSSSGTITIFAEDLNEVSVTPPVGSTPVVATAFSDDGAMIGGVCVDGTYKIWPVREGVVSNRKPLFEGILPEPFPASMAFSPDGKSVLFGTGLRTKHAGVAVLGLTADATRFTTTKTEAAITQIQFLNRSNAFISRDFRGTTSVWKIEHGNDGLVLSNEFQLLGIESLSVHPNGLTAFQVKGKEKPVVFTVDDILKRNTFKDNLLGIERQEP